MSKENYNCPHCGSEPLWISGGYPTPDGKALLKRRQCGSLIDPLYPANEERSELCLEREARQKAEAENSELHELLERALVVEALTLSGTWEQRAIRDQYDLLKHSSGAAR